jgi:hypothetical protein
MLVIGLALQDGRASHVGSVEQSAARDKSLTSEASLAKNEREQVGVKAMRIMTAALTMVLAIAPVSITWAAGPVPQWNVIYVGSVQDSDSLGTEAVSIYPYTGVPVETGCLYDDLYVIRDPLILHSALALTTTAIAMGWPLLVQTSGVCDSSGRPLVSAVRTGTSN